jgi:hypothetical protein
MTASLHALLSYLLLVAICNLLVSHTFELLSVPLNKLLKVSLSYSLSSFVHESVNIGWFRSLLNRVNFFFTSSCFSVFNLVLDTCFGWNGSVCRCT